MSLDQLIVSSLTGNVLASQNTVSFSGDTTPVLILLFLILIVLIVGIVLLKKSFFKRQ